MSLNLTKEQTFTITPRHADDPDARACDMHGCDSFGAIEVRVVGAERSQRVCYEHLGVGLEGAVLQNLYEQANDAQRCPVSSDGQHNRDGNGLCHICDDQAEPKPLVAGKMMIF